MKKLFLLLVSVFTLQFASADNDKPIAFEQLPATAQQFVKQNFADQKVAFVKKESELFDASYELMFVSGDKIEFNKNGDWKEVDCKRSEVPAKIVPAKIKSTISQHYNNAKVKKISRDLKKGKTEVKLSSGIELEFNKYYQVIDVDD